MTESSAKTVLAKQRKQMSVALLLIDVINDFDYPNGRETLHNARKIVSALARLKARARRAEIPVIYVNDNFGEWRSDARKLVAWCTRADASGIDFVKMLQPEEDDYFVLKPMHSAFFQTPLEILLRHLGISTLILTGIATNSCILCTAQDARMRDFRVFVPPDCAAARTQQEHDQSIRHLKDMVNVRITRSRSLRLSTIASQPSSR